MSQSEKAGYYRALQDAGVEFTKHYREYTTGELKEAYDRLAAKSNPQPQVEGSADSGLPGSGEWFPQQPEQTRQESMAQHPSRPQRPRPPVAQRDPREMAGQRLNSQPEDEPIRVDELGRVWYQEEVLKPAFPKPRGRRVLDYIETGTKQQTVKSGDYMESFEVAGDDPGRPAQVKITLPSYQVGIYKDPRLPFRVHVYNGNTGFDLFEVNNYYGGAELVPAEIKRKYVENVLCYDIRTTVRAIQTEYRQLQLAGKV